MDVQDNPLSRATLSVARATLLAGILGLIGTILGLTFGTKHGAEQAALETTEFQQQAAQQAAEIQMLSQMLAEREASFRAVSEKLADYDARLVDLTKQLGEKSAQAAPSGSETPTTTESLTASNQLSHATPQSTINAKEQGFLFEVLGCRDEGSSILCDIVVTNQRGDRWIWISEGFDSRTYVVDAAGNRCSAKDATFTWGTLVEGVPQRMTFEFRGCPRNVAHLSYLELSFRLGSPISRRDFRVPFRDIPVYRG